MNKLQQGLLGLAVAGLGSWLLSRNGRGNYSFRDKAVLITGGSRGLGLVLARLLTEEGANVAICARDRAELDRAADDLTTRGQPPLTLPCDVTEPEQVRDTVTAVEAHFGRVDVLINNAGTITVGPMSAMTRQDYEEAMNVNFWGAYNAVEAVLPGMRRRQEGRIVNVSSIGGKIGVPHLMPYSASKFALVGYSQALRAELADDGITVTTVCPGLMRTGSPRQAFFKGQHESEYTWFSIADSLPGLTISAETAARATIEACRRGEAEAVLSLPAQLGVLAQALMPEATALLSGLVNRLLPSPDGNTEKKQGKDSESRLSPSFLTALTEKAAVANNQIE